jgi:NitT/TauT family transport system ATP-binding protein
VTAYEEKGPLLTIKGIRKSYDDTVILKDVKGTIRDVYRPGLTQGQVVGILGPSGIGKSTLLRIIAGLEEPDAGEILIGIEQLPTRRGQVGVIAQDYPLFADRSLLENLLLGAEQGGKNRQEGDGKDARAVVDRMMEKFGLSERGNAYPCQLSGGQRQRAAIAQQILCSSHLLIMDEPFAGLDPVMKDMACQLIEEVASAEDDLTILVITHDIREAIKISDELWMMGRDLTPEGKAIPGAYIKTFHDLKAMGLAWRPDLTRSQEFMDFERKVRDEFKTL